MAAAVSVFADRGSLAESPLSRQDWTELASKTYREIDFHQAYLQAMQKWLEAQDVQQLYRDLLQHPDYRVRLFALQGLEAKTVTKADRQAVFRAPWQSGVPAEVRQLASFMIQGKAPKTWELITAKGKVSIELATAYAPITCANLVTLSKQGYFDGMPIHRVVPNFVVQGGDSRGDGSGGPGYAIPCEVNPLRYRRGAVGMALAGKDTGGSQFFICHSDQPHLDGGYTVFGRVVAGMDLVDRLEEGDVILSAKVK